MLAALLASIAFGGMQSVSLMWERERRVLTEVRNASLTLLLEGCRARATNLTEDKESDDAVDLLTDDELRLVPKRWLRTGTPDRDTATE